MIIYRFARVNAGASTQVVDFYKNGHRLWLVFLENGGKFHEFPMRHSAEEYLHAYIETAGLADESKTPLFRSTRGRSGVLTDRPMARQDVFQMIQKRAPKADLRVQASRPTFRIPFLTPLL